MKKTHLLIMQLSIIKLNYACNRHYLVQHIIITKVDVEFQPADWLKISCENVKKVKKRKNYPRFMPNYASYRNFNH